MKKFIYALQSQYRKLEQKMEMMIIQMMSNSF